MKTILLTMVLLFSFSNVWACYDQKLSDKVNFDNCSVDAEQGDASAQFNLGLMYFEGQGVARDYNQAVKRFQKAAEQGDADAQYNLGFMCFEGLGVTQDYKQAVKWYQKAAEQGDADAQYNLGNMYFKGQGVAQNYVRAHMWWNIAGTSGMSDAVNNRDVIAKKMTSSQLQEAQKMAGEWMIDRE